MQWLPKWLLDKRFFFFNFDVLIVMLLIIRLLFRYRDDHFPHNIYCLVGCLIRFRAALIGEKRSLCIIYK